MAQITLKEFQEFAQVRIADGLDNPQRLQAKVKEVFDFAAANENAMDAEAKAYFNKVLEALSSMVESGLEKIADSSEKRKMSRLVALTKGKHHSAKGLADGLGRPLPRPFAVAEAAKPVFLSSLQSLLDVLFDATRQPQNGVAQFGVLSMLYWSVDELNAAFYLAERKYATQAYSHLRTVYDLLEKVELLFKQPQWAEVWGSDDKKKIIRELSPSAIRRKLGKPKFDLVYSFFSELGSHGTFEAVRRRVVKRGGGSDRTQVGMWLGGVPWDSEVVISVSCCIFAVMSALMLAIEVFESRLHAAESSEVLKDRSKEAAEFLQKHFVGSMNEAGVDASELLKLLKTVLIL